PFEPEIARGRLGYLARLQGTIDDAFTDQEPGKILHEYRRGEMATCREIPFIPYYGSVDATPLFVMLAAEYLKWTYDLDFMREIWPAIERALGWMQAVGDAQGRGFLTYARRSPVGLPNQGWKDSHDSVMHADGRLAEPPIALAEVQGYQYAALLGAATLAEAIGPDADAPAPRRWRRRSVVARTRRRCAPARAGCKNVSRRISGCPTRRSTRWRSTVRARRVA